MEQRVQGTLKIWLDPFVVLRAPYIFNLRMDPYEHAIITSNTYYDWHLRHIYLCVPAQGREVDEAARRPPLCHRA